MDEKIKNRMMALYDEAYADIVNMNNDKDFGIISKEAYEKKKAYCKGVMNTIEKIVNEYGCFVNRSGGVHFVDRL